MSKTEKWVSVSEYAKKYKIKHQQILYVWMLRGKVKWRETEVVVRRKQIYDG